MKSEKNYMGFLILRGGGTGEAGEAAASPKFRGLLKGKFSYIG